MLTTIFIFILPYFVKGVHVNGFFNVFLFTIALAFLNSIIKPILVLLSLPITIVTLGLFLIFINTGMIYLAAYLVGGVYIEDFVHGILFSILMSVISALVDWIVGN